VRQPVQDFKSFQRYHGLKSEVAEDGRPKIAFFEKRPLTGKFSKIFSERIHHLSDPRLVCKFREIWPTSMGKVMHYLPDQKKTIGWRSSSCFHVDRTQNLSGPAPDNILGVPKFHPNPFTSGGVIAERVNVVQTRPTVFPILSEASSQGSHSPGKLWNFANLENSWNFMLDLEFLV